MWRDICRDMSIFNIKKNKKIDYGTVPVPYSVTVTDPCKILLVRYRTVPYQFIFFSVTFKRFSERKIFDYGTYLPVPVPVFENHFSCVNMYFLYGTIVPGRND